MFPSEVAAAVAAAGARLVVVGDAEYPPALWELFDPPAGLFVRGRDLREDGVRVAIVGARNATESARSRPPASAAAGRGQRQVVTRSARRPPLGGPPSGRWPRAGPTLAVLGSGDRRRLPSGRTLSSWRGSRRRVGGERVPAGDPRRGTCRFRARDAEGWRDVPRRGRGGGREEERVHDHCRARPGPGRRVFAVPG